MCEYDVTFSQLLQKLNVQRKMYSIVRSAGWSKLELVSVRLNPARHQSAAGQNRHNELGATYPHFVPTHLLYFLSHFKHKSYHIQIYEYKCRYKFKYNFKFKYIYKDDTTKIQIQHIHGPSAYKYRYRNRWRYRWRYRYRYKCRYTYTDSICFVKKGWSWIDLHSEILFRDGFCDKCV